MRVRLAVDRSRIKEDSFCPRVETAVSSGCERKFRRLPTRKEEGRGGGELEEAIGREGGVDDDEQRVLGKLEL